MQTLEDRVAEGLPPVPWPLQRVERSRLRGRHDAEAGARALLLPDMEARRAALVDGAAGRHDLRPDARTVPISRAGYVHAV